ncbi:MAG: universal stress protein [Myxococcales bacterium]|nr:universal stress protein [Myxococcales bacterium]
MSAQHMLLAFDFSDSSRRAMMTARQLAATLKSAIDVVYVLDDPFSEIANTPKESIWATERELEEHVAAIRAQLAGEVEEIFGPEAQAITLHVRRGTPLHAILDQRSAIGADLVVSGTTGKGGVARTLMGSVSQKLLQRCPVPVLIVP